MRKLAERYEVLTDATYDAETRRWEATAELHSAMGRRLLTEVRYGVNEDQARWKAEAAVLEAHGRNMREVIRGEEK